VTLDIRPVGYGDPDVAPLVARLQQFYVERYGGPDEDPTSAEMFESPEGAFFLGYDGGVPVAMGSWRREHVSRLGATRSAEVKRMYVVPEARGLGYARRMLAHLEETAAAAGYEALLLSTGSRQPEAITLYESAGYLPVEGFGHYAGGELNRCFGKRLDAPVTAC
jgi:GNAT superfamily N-acetyltransferase